MPRIVLLSTIVLSAFACASADDPRESGLPIGLDVVHSEHMRTPGRLQLRELRMHRVSDVGEASEPYIEGTWIGGFFDATGDVVGPKGAAPRGRSLTRGRLELRSVAFFRTVDPRPAAYPYVEGWRDDDTGGFYPLGGVVRSAP